MKVIHVYYEKQMRACVSCIHGRISTHILRVSNSLSVPYNSILSLFGDKRSWAGNTGLLHKSPSPYSPMGVGEGVSPPTQLQLLLHHSSLPLSLPQSCMNQGYMMVVLLLHSVLLHSLNIGALTLSHKGVSYRFCALVTD